MLAGDGGRQNGEPAAGTGLHVPDEPPCQVAEMRVAGQVGLPLVVVVGRVERITTFERARQGRQLSGRGGAGSG